MFRRNQQTKAVTAIIEAIKSLDSLIDVIQAIPNYEDSYDSLLDAMNAFVLIQERLMKTPEVDENGATLLELARGLSRYQNSSTSVLIYHFKKGTVSVNDEPCYDYKRRLSNEEWKTTQLVLPKPTGE